MGEYNNQDKPIRNFIVVTENDVSDWDDNTGKIYHYPNRYQKLITPGALLIYYKGAMRDKSFSAVRKSPNSHYFGIAKVDTITVDERNPKNKFATIIDYVPFDYAIDFKDNTGVYFESKHIKKTNYWRDAVRRIDEETYNRIISQVGMKVIEPIDAEETSLLNDIQVLPIEEVNYIVSDKNPLKPNIKSDKESKETTSVSTKRYSKNSKKIGDRGEEIVYKYLNDESIKYNYKEIDWLAKKNITPGYDIQYLDEENNTHCIEVKSTQSKNFVEFILTVNEWQAAMEQEFYDVCLVSNCLSKNPEIFHLGNPYKLVSENKIEIEPASYKLKLKDDQS